MKREFLSIDTVFYVELKDNDTHLVSFIHC